ncbi:MAG: SDR family oxidoreductase [Deltaproteobacteria bacterium]|nr:SDR family oxidoreductase [Deltaproteobacteria bacterium]
MKVLILGGNGLLGHKVWQVCRRRLDAWVTVRRGYEDYERYGLFDPTRLLGGVNVLEIDSVMGALDKVRPDVVVNCIGIVPRSHGSEDAITGLKVNALFPHQLASICESFNARLIHMSTDCVFSGGKGMYTEEDRPDPEDLYGRCKLLGEVTSPHCLTIRSSMIGRELTGAKGLVEWFLGQRGQRVRGYRNAIFSGFPTLILAQVMESLIERRPRLSGLYHVSSEPISKYEVLSLVKETYGVAIEIERFEDFRVNRSLDSSRFRAATGFMSKPWPEMIRMMAEDATPYEDWRNTGAT